MKMFGEKNKRITELEAQIASYDEVSPYLDDARAIHNTVAELASTPYTSTAIARLAFERVKQEKIGTVHNQLAAEYYEKYRTELYNNLYEAEKLNHGDEIAQTASEHVAMDTQLRLKLIEQAKQQLWKDKIAEVAFAEVTAQEAVVEREKQRLIALNQFDVRFVDEGRLDLEDQKLCDLLKVGDTLNLYFEKYKKDPGTLTYTWSEDGEKKKDWAFTSASQSIYYRASPSSGETQLVSSDSTTSSIAMVNYARSSEKAIFEHDQLVMGLQLAVTRNRKMGETDSPLFCIEPYGSPMPIRLIGCDFKTKNLNFFNDSQQK
jgi:hypothetical protein